MSLDFGDRSKQEAVSALCSLEEGYKAGGKHISYARRGAVGGWRVLT